MKIKTLLKEYDEMLKEIEDFSTKIKKRVKEIEIEEGDLNKFDDYLKVVEK